MEPTSKETELYINTARKDLIARYRESGKRLTYAMMGEFFQGWLTAHRASQAEVGRLREAARAALGCFTFEINPSNYDHEQVCELNANAVEACKILDAALATAPADSNEEKNDE